uniref:Uncharacterized protein n=1 Tax=Timema cristinae TaxID=61476 RepID=A0A7R9GTU5_TIMCR|nr:unnamed protein product [Timema cristinae]
MQNKLNGKEIHLLVSLATCNVRATSLARSCHLQQSVISEVLHTFFTKTECGSTCGLFTSSTSSLLNVTTSVAIPQFMKKIQKFLYRTVHFTVPATVVFDCCAHTQIGGGGEEGGTASKYRRGVTFFCLSIGNPSKTYNWEKTRDDCITFFEGTRDSDYCNFTTVLEEEAPITAITGNSDSLALPSLIYIRRKNDHEKQKNDNAVAQYVL